LLSLVLVCLGLYYGLALRVYNRTHIDVDDERIRVTRRPLPRLLLEPTVVGLERVRAIRYAETAVSKKEGYDTPRYNVWAETVDGSRRLIVQDVLEDYAVFIAQELNERLMTETAPDVSRLVDDDESMREMPPDTESVRLPKNQAH
ncbi:MAG TPA: hypothetical protein VKA67_03955, partial [Verrucomicrobiae bacterium]|nr:hypothetical protein [Verrucomicrobiae bacterium]